MIPQKKLFFPPDLVARLAPDLCPFTVDPASPDLGGGLTQAQNCFTAVPVPPDLEGVHTARKGCPWIIGISEPQETETITETGLGRWPSPRHCTDRPKHTPSLRVTVPSRLGETVISSYTQKQTQRIWQNEETEEYILNKRTIKNFRKIY